MKTIAITIDEYVLNKVKALEEREDRSRSDIIREAVRQYVIQRERQLEQTRETEIFRKNRKKLQRQAAALVREQAKA